MMLRQQILAMTRAGMSVREVREALGVEEEVVVVALEALGGSTVLRREVRKELNGQVVDSPEAPRPQNAEKVPHEPEEEEEEVTAGEAKEMLGILKTIARNGMEDATTRVNAAKYVHGVRAGYHRRYLDLDVNRGNLLLQINEAFANASARAAAALRGGQAAPVLNVTPPSEKPNESNA